MQSIIKISEGAAIALHAADHLARSKGLSSAAGMAEELEVSYNHLSKVLQQLTKAGLVTPTRGPSGGFALTPAGRNARVRDFLRAIDGAPATRPCLMKERICRRATCMLGRFIEETNKRFETMINKKISRISKRR